MRHQGGTMEQNAEMDDRFMSEILRDFYEKAAQLDAVAEFSVVLTGDQDGHYRAAIVADGESVLAKGSSASWFDAVSRATARGLVAIESIQERIAAMDE